MSIQKGCIYRSLQWQHNMDLSVLLIKVANLYVSPVILLEFLDYSESHLSQLSQKLVVWPKKTLWSVISFLGLLPFCSEYLLHFNSLFVLLYCISLYLENIPLLHYIKRKKMTSLSSANQNEAQFPRCTQSIRISILRALEKRLYTHAMHIS